MLSPYPSKSDLRQTALANRDGLDETSSIQASTSVSCAASWYLRDKCAAAYYAIGSEIDPGPLMQTLVEQGAWLALPVLLDRETMVFRAWDQTKALVPVGFGTLGPDADQNKVLPDLIFAPLAAFSSTGQRIGYGKGHYDRALSKMHVAGHVPALVGLAFDGQEVPPFEVEPHDVSLDGVLTPTGLRIFERGHDALAPYLGEATI